MDQIEQAHQINKYNPWKYITIGLTMFIVILVSYHLVVIRKSPDSIPQIINKEESARTPTNTTPAFPPPYINPDKYHFEKEQWKNQCVQDWCFSLPPQTQAVETAAPNMEARLEIFLLDKIDYKKYLIWFGYPLSIGNPPKTFEDVISQQIPALFKELKHICTEDVVLIDSSLKSKIIYRCKGDLSEAVAVIWSDKDQKYFVVDIKPIGLSTNTSDDELMRFFRLFAPQVKPKV